MLSRLFSNHVKNHKNQEFADYVGFHIENLQFVKIIKIKVRRLCWISY